MNDIFSIKKEISQKSVDQFSQSMKTKENPKLKKRLSIDNPNINIPNIPNSNTKHTRRQSSGIIGRITLKEETINKIYNSKEKTNHPKKIKIIKIIIIIILIKIKIIIVKMIIIILIKLIIQINIIRIKIMIIKLIIIMEISIKIRI